MNVSMALAHRNTSKTTISIVVFLTVFLTVTSLHNNEYCLVIAQACSTRLTFGVEAGAVSELRRVKIINYLSCWRSCGLLTL